MNRTGNKLQNETGVGSGEDYSFIDTLEAGYWIYLAGGLIVIFKPEYFAEWVKFAVIFSMIMLPFMYIEGKASRSNAPWAKTFWFIESIINNTFKSIFLVVMGLMALFLIVAPLYWLFTKLF